MKITVDDIYSVSEERIKNDLLSDKFYLDSNESEKNIIEIKIRGHQVIGFTDSSGLRWAGEYKFCLGCKKFRITTCSACGCGHCLTCNYRFTCMPYSTSGTVVFNSFPLFGNGLPDLNRSNNYVEIGKND